MLTALDSVAQSCLTLRPHELQPARLLCPWDSPGKNTGVGCHAFLQGIFQTQGSNSQFPVSPELAGQFFTTGKLSVTYDCDVTVSAEAGLYSWTSGYNRVFPTMEGRPACQSFAFSSQLECEFPARRAQVLCFSTRPSMMPSASVMRADIHQRLHQIP